VAALGARPGLVPVAAGLLAFALTAASLLLRAQALDLPAYDNAFFEQVVWNLGHGQGFSGTFFPADFLGLHFSPLLVLPALLELAWPDGRLLALVHALAIAATAPAAFLFLRALLGDRPRADWAAVALAAPVPFWAELQQAARAGFHTEALALPALLLAGWAGLRGRTLACCALALVALTAREDQAYGVALIGLLLFFQGPSRRLGAGLVAAACTWALAVELVVMPGLRGGVVSQVDNYYHWLHEASPVAVCAALLNPSGWLAFAGMVASLAGLPLLRPRWFALSLPPLFADLLSAHHPQPELLFQYSLPLVVPLLVAAGLGGRRLLDWGPREGRLTRLVIPALAVPALLVAVLAGPLARTPLAPASARQQLLACTTGLPAAAPLAADDAVALPLAARPVLKIVTEASANDFVVVDRTGRVPSYIDAPHREAVLARLPAAGRRVLCDDGRFQLWTPAGG
jgi:uncharacterized membrane protein